MPPILVQPGLELTAPAFQGEHLSLLAKMLSRRKDAGHCLEAGRSCMHRLSEWLGVKRNRSMFKDTMVLVMDLYVCVCVCGNVNNTTWAFKSGPVHVCTSYCPLQLNVGPTFWENNKLECSQCWNFAWAKNVTCNVGTCNVERDTTYATKTKPLSLFFHCDDDEIDPLQTSVKQWCYQDQRYILYRMTK